MISLEQIYENMCYTGEVISESTYISEQTLFDVDTVNISTVSPENMSKVIYRGIVDDELSNENIIFCNMPGVEGTIKITTDNNEDLYVEVYAGNNQVDSFVATSVPSRFTIDEFERELNIFKAELT